jgi:predicted dehydrogenase
MPSEREPPVDIGIGVIGAGAIAEAHGAAYRAVGARVVGVMSRHAEDARRLASVLEAAYRSAASGDVVKVNGVTEGAT